MYHSLTISGKNTWDTWHLIPPTRPVVNPPEVKTQIMEIPGRNGFLDLSELLTGDIVYGSRQGSWTFIAHPDYHDTEPWNVRYQRIAQYLHGKTHTVILEDDPNYYYEGRLKVNQWAPGANWSQVAIDYTLMPFKKEITMSDEPWKWDPFCFVGGIIRGYHGIDISGTKEIHIDTGEERVTPIIIGSNCSGLTLLHRGFFYPISNGENIIPGLTLKGEGNTLLFNGTGTVAIRFRGGWL